MARNSLTLNADGTLDGVQMAIVNKRMEAICAKMANTLLRTGRSGVLNSARDFSCCIVTAGEPAAHGQREPADPRPARRRHDVRVDAGVSPRAQAGRRLPPQLALPRLLPPRRPHHARAGAGRRGRAPLHHGRQGASGGLRQLHRHHLSRQRARRVRGRRADLPGGPDPAGLRGHRGHRPHVHAPHSRAGAMVGRLPGGARRGADRRARDHGLRQRDRLGHPLPVRRAVVRLQRAADDRRRAQDAGRAGRDHVHARSLPQRRGREFRSRSWSR